MGCANAVGRRSEPLPAELQAAARKYFNLGELPVTLTTAAKGQALVVKAAGLDHDDLLLAFEAGFHARRYWIREAAIHVNRGLFLATFELLPRGGREGGEEADAERAMSSARGSVSVKRLAASPRVSAACGDGVDQEAAVELLGMTPIVTPLNLGSRQLAGSSEDPGDGADQEAAVELLGMTPVPTPLNLGVTAPAASADRADQEAAPEESPSMLLAAEDEAALEELRFGSMPSEAAGERAGKEAAARGPQAPSTTTLAEADQRAARLGAHVRLTIVREWAPGLRVALRRTIQDSGLRIVMARLSLSASAASRTVKDTLWLASGQRKFGAEPAGAPAWISELSDSLCRAQPEELGVFSTVGGQVDGLKTVLQRITSSGGSSDPLDEQRLPEPLRRKAACLQYRVEQSSGWGLQFDGIDKYTGSGMGVAHSGRHVLEFATFFVKKPTDEGHDAPVSPWSATFAALTSAMRRQSVAEFITEYHPDRSCLTIFKAFLNDVLPVGVRAGARATAEQLPTMPVSADGRWSGADALRGLRTIHLCDVVNWNTYCLMSKVGKAPGDSLERMLLVEEARASGFTLADIESKTAAEIFARTGLGKLVMGVLKIWKEEHSVEHKVKDVSVAWSSSEFELIQGDYRKVMDVYIELERPIEASHLVV